MLQKTSYLATAAVVLALGASSIQSAELPVHGGPGGSDFRQRCGVGEYLVGFDARAGAWLDRIQIICAPISKDGMNLGKPRLGGPPAGGTGGGPTGAQCLRQDSAISSIEFTHTWHGSGGGVAELADIVAIAYVTGLTFRCNYTESPERAAPSSVRIVPEPGTSPRRQRQRYTSTCPPGELAVGIHGRAGDYIDALGLICGRAGPPIPAMGRSKPGGNVPSVGAGARIGGTVRDVIPPPKQAPAPNPPPPGPKAFPLACQGSGGMQVSSSGDVVTIVFRRAPAAASSPPGPGQCAWLDRPVSGNEPSMLVLPSGTANRDAVTAAARQGGEFQVQAFNNNQGALVTAGVDFAVVMTERPPETQGAPQPGLQLARVIKAANVRIGPNGQVIATLPAGAVVPINRCEASWCQVVLPALGPVAWVHQSLLQF